MAYAASISIVEVPTPRPGRLAYVLTVTETEIATTSQWDSTGSSTGNTLATPGVRLPPVFRIVSRKVNRTAGTASTVALVLAKATGITAAGPDSINLDAAAAAINDNTSIPVYAPNGLFARTTPDTSHATNTATTQILIVSGLEP